MKVKELIELLKKQDPEKRVVVAGYEGGSNDVIDLEETKLWLFRNDEWYYGVHDEYNLNEETDPHDEIGLRLVGGYNKLDLESWVAQHSNTGRGKEDEDGQKI